VYVSVFGKVTKHTYVTAAMPPQSKLLEKAIITFRLVISHCNAELRRSVPSENLFLITYGFVA